jgi:Delta14-sterol reductase
VEDDSSAIAAIPVAGGTPLEARAPGKVIGVYSSFGAVLLLVVLPPLVYWMWMCLQLDGGAFLIPSTVEGLQGLLAHFPWPTPTAAAIYLGWFGFQVLLQLYAPGKIVKGIRLADGSRLDYKMNGWFTWWFTWAAIALGVCLGLVSPTVLADNFGPLMTVANICAFVLAGYLFWYGRRNPKGEHVSGRGVYDYFMGTSLNPRIGSFDLKLFCEARPGLIGWVAIDLSLAAKQHALYGTVTLPMVLVCSFQFFYIADYYFHEEAILTTWDIKHENFGWMLCWGDLVWVPFTYSIQAYYLMTHTHDLPVWAAAGIVLLNFAGYTIFRGTNIQKHKFRKNPEIMVWGKKASYIKTENGSLLLTSGWWGVARHINYMGDLMMGLAWCLVCGFGKVLPYFYIIYFTILLVHRERRDHETCATKYGKDWDAYCAKVKYRIVPAVY